MFPCLCHPKDFLSCPRNRVLGLQGKRRKLQLSCISEYVSVKGLHIEGLECVLLHCRTSRGAASATMTC